MDISNPSLLPTQTVPRVIALDDLERRLEMLRKYGVREYRDGDVCITINPTVVPMVATQKVVQGVLCDAP